MILNDLDLMVYVNKSFYDNMFKCTPKPFLVTDSNILCYFVSRVSCMSDLMYYKEGNLFFHKNLPRQQHKENNHKKD